jgi:hypothetical protein
LPIRDFRHLPLDSFSVILLRIPGIFFLSGGVSLAVGAVIWLMDGILIWFGVRTFARASLIARI